MPEFSASEGKSQKIGIYAASFTAKFSELYKMYLFSLLKRKKDVQYAYFGVDKSRNMV